MRSILTLVITLLFCLGACCQAASNITASNPVSLDSLRKQLQLIIQDVKNQYIHLRADSNKGKDDVSDKLTRDLQGTMNNLVEIFHDTSVVFIAPITVSFNGKEFTELVKRWDHALGSALGKGSKRSQWKQNGVEHTIENYIEYAYDGVWIVLYYAQLGDRGNEYFSTVTISNGKPLR